jgi:hypothetical protein
VSGAKTIAGVDVVVGAIPDGPVEWYHWWDAPDGTAAASFGRAAGGYFVRFPECADVWIAAEGPIRYRPAPAMDARTIDAVIAHQVIPLALDARGQMVLHASAIAVDGRAVAFVAAPGTGKSSLAAAFEELGRQIVADDCVVVRLEGAPSVTGLSSVIRLRGASAEFFASGCPDARGKMVRVGETSWRGDESFLLDAIVELKPVEPDAPPRLIRRHGRDSIAGLLPNIFRIDPYDRVRLQRELLDVTRLATSVEQFVLHVPRSLERLGDVAQTVERWLR